MLCFCFVFRRLVCINVNEYPRGNQKWTIQRNWQHRVHKTNFSGLPIRYSLITFIYNRQYGNWLCLSASNATRLRFYYQKWKIYNGKITIITIVLNKLSLCDSFWNRVYISMLVYTGVRSVFVFLSIHIDVCHIWINLRGGQKTNTKEKTSSYLGSYRILKFHRICRCFALLVWTEYYLIPAVIDFCYQ